MIKKQRNPLIAVTARTEVHDAIKWVSNPQAYFDAIRFVEGIPVMVDHKEDIDVLVDLFDALLVTGGEDLNPAYYHQEKLSDAPLMDPCIDELDMQLIQAFHARNKPILGICRGMQCINVAFGGSLCQDIPASYQFSAGQHDQRQQIPVKDYENTTCHEVHSIPETQLHTVLGSSCLVNSFHHQCVDQLAEGFIASVFANDGIIEGIEQGHTIGVQWHPEWLMTDEKHIGLFQHFIMEARKQMASHD